MEDIKLSSDEWWLEKHRELVKKTSISKDNILNFDQLNEHINDYPANHSYAIKLSSDAWRVLDRLKKGFEIWYNGKFSECRAELIKEGEKQPIIAKLIEVRITSKYEKEYTEWNEKITGAEYNHRMLSEFLKIWGSLGYSYHNLSENMRFDMSTSADLVGNRIEKKQGMETMMQLRRKE